MDVRKDKGNGGEISLTNSLSNIFPVRALKNLRGDFLRPIIKTLYSQKDVSAALPYPLFPYVSNPS